jgi:hypothetical protein
MITITKVQLHKEVKGNTAARTFAATTGKERGNLANTTSHPSRRMKNGLISLLGMGAMALLASGTASANNDSNSTADSTMVVTASNTARNQLLVYSTTGSLLKSIPTQGQGGVGGNAGGIAQHGNLLAAVNFGSSNVSVFNEVPGASSFNMAELVPSVASPVSVAFGNNHLYVLTTTHVESHPIYRNWVSTSPDGVVALVKGDGSAAQVGVVNGQLVITEKSNAIETVPVDSDGAVTGSADLVSNIPSNVNAPFGLATRGNNAYVTIAHANEISLVRNGDVLTVTGSGTQSAPCWVALDGPFLFSANSPSKSVSRYAVYGQKIIQDAAVAAQFNGSPTDIAYGSGFAAVIDNNGTQSHVSIFKVDEDGNLTLNGIATINSASTNGVVVVHHQKDRDF